jgi:glycerophosphoryl diester phosphodiesterase
MIVLAHRGASGHSPENTLSAFRLARDLGADGLELDVQLSRDGAVVVLHDADVQRTSDGRGPVSSMTLEQLRALDFGAWYSEDFRNERIPLLSEVVDFVAASGLWLNIELKGDPTIDPDLPGAVAALVNGRLDPSRTILSSFDVPSMDAVAMHLPLFPRALLVERLDRAAWKELSRRDARGDPFFRFVHPHFRALDPARVSRIHASGQRVLPWTLDRVGPLDRCLSLGVDGVITGYPERAVGR